MHTIAVFITNHPLLGVYVYFQIGIICAIIYSVGVHHHHQVDDDDEKGIFSFIILFILFGPVLLVFGIPFFICAFINGIGKVIAYIIERNE